MKYKYICEMLMSLCIIIFSDKWWNSLNITQSPRYLPSYLARRHTVCGWHLVLSSEPHPKTHLIIAKKIKPFVPHHIIKLGQETVGFYFRGSYKINKRFRKGGKSKNKYWWNRDGIIGLSEGSSENEEESDIL